MPPQDASLKWYAFENLIANLFRKLRAEKVLQNVSLAGHQIDIYIEEKTTSGQILRTAIECKSSRYPIGKDIVTRFALIFDFLRRGGFIDRGIIISLKGFTKEAYNVAKAYDIDLLKIEDLEARVRQYAPIDPIIKEAEKTPPPKKENNLLFVLMPFRDDLHDLYIYGIRGAAEKTGFYCVRADDIEHNRDIMEEILDHIEISRVIVAEMTDKNPNVCYEVGIAHGKNKEVILIIREGSEIPFDLKSKHFIIYKNIHDLEQKLTRRLKSIREREANETNRREVNANIA